MGCSTRCQLYRAKELEWIAPVAAASIMDYQYKANEFADAGRWTDECHETAQHQLNHEEADWQTLARRFGDPSGANRWHLMTPDERAGKGNPVPGPTAIPSLLPLPKVLATFGEPSRRAQSLGVLQQSPYSSGAWVTLYRPDGKAMDQGLTDGDGILIFGAQPNDKLLMISLDGKLWAQQVLPISGCIALQPRSRSAGCRPRRRAGTTRQPAI